MRMRKFVGVAVAASIAAWSASPAAAHPFHHFWWHHFHPRPHHFLSSGGHLSPWPAFLVIGGVASTMFNAAIVWNTQCRELTSQEAMTSFFLPVVGIAFDARANKCKH